MNNIFKKKAEKKEKPSSTDNPFLNSRRKYNELVGQVVASRRILQAVVVIMAMMGFASVGGWIHLVSQSKFIPYIVEVDKLGQHVAVQKANTIDEAIANRVVMAEIAAFIADARMVTPDAALQSDAINRLYARMNPEDPASHKMTQWLNGDAEKNPFARASKEAVSVEIESVIPQTTASWLVDWIERVYSRQGDLAQPPFRMRALVTYYIAPPNENITEEDIRRNPLGIFISDFNWSRRVEGN